FGINYRLKMSDLETIINNNLYDIQKGYINISNIKLLNTNDFHNNDNWFLIYLGIKLHTINLQENNLQR
ncbi:MAG: hypothetical protein JSV32_01030, partial [Dehalococcoidia bacterium]